MCHSGGTEALAILLVIHSVCVIQSVSFPSPHSHVFSPVLVIRSFNGPDYSQTSARADAGSAESR